MLKLGKKVPSESWNRGQQTELPSILIAHVRSDGYIFQFIMQIIFSAISKGKYTQFVGKILSKQEHAKFSLIS